MTTPLSVTLEAKLDKLQQNFNDAAKMGDDTIGRIESSFKNANPDAGQMLERFQASAEGPAREAGSAIGLLIAGGIAAGLAGISASVLKTVDALSAIGDRSDDLRLPVNLLQGLSVAAAEARVPVDKLNAALDQFTKVSKQDSTDAKEFYKALGNISAASVDAFKNADTQAERLGIVSNALKSTTDEVKRAQLALQVFKTDNERLIALLGDGAAGFDRYRENAAKLGLEINESLVKQAQEAKSQLLLLARVLGDQFTSAVGGLIPVLVKIMPFLKAIAFAARAVSDIFATDATASTKQLRSELDGVVDRWVDLKTQRDALAKRLEESKETEADGSPLLKSLRSSLGINTLTAADLKTLDDDIKRLEDRSKFLRDKIASDEAAPVKPDKPAFEGRPSLKDEVRDRFDAAADAIDKRTAAHLAEASAIDLGTAARERAKIAAQLETVAMQINKEAGLGANVVTAEQRQRIDEVAEAYGRAAAAIEQAHFPLATFAREAANTNKQLSQFAAGSLETITGEFANVVTGTKTVADAFKSMTQSITNDLAKLAIRQSITGPLAKALLGGIDVGGFPFDFGLTPGPGRAGGGPVSPGTVYPVGENGPEWFAPDTPGMIIPNDAVGRGGGGVINNLNIIAPPGATVSRQESRNSSGGVDLTAIIDMAVAKNMLDPGSQSSRALGARGRLRLR